MSQTKIQTQRRRIGKVNHYDVEMLSSELRLKLKIKGINFADIDNILVPS